MSEGLARRRRVRAQTTDKRAKETQGMRRVGWAGQVKGFGLSLEGTGEPWRRLEQRRGRAGEGLGGLGRSPGRPQK